MAHDRLTRRLFPIVVFLLACLQYVNTVSYDYAWDDKLVITANDYTKKGIRGLPEIFSKRVSVPHKSEYRPVPQALHAIEYEAFGSNPHTGHLFSVLWYATTCVLVYLFVRFVFVRLNPLFAFLVALLFVVHPLHVEVVANIKSRDEILALCFGLSAIVLMVKGLERLRWMLMIAGAVCLLLACLSKTNAVTLLPLVALVAWYRSDGYTLTRRFLISGVVIALCTAALVTVIRHMQNTVSPDTLVYLNSTVLNNIFLWSAHPHTIVPTALVIIARYVWLFLFPHPLIHLYGYNQIPLSTWGDPATWLVVAGLAGTAVLLAQTLPAKLPLAFGLVWAALTYSVYSNLVFYAPDTMADRYLFAPSIGLAIVAVYGVFQLGAIDLSAPAFAHRRARTAIALLSIALVAYFARTVVGNQDWQNDSTLIHNRIQYMEDNAAAQVIYGYTLDQESLALPPGDAKRERKAAAMRAYTRAIRVYPDFQGAWNAVGRLFAEEGIYDKAELAFLKAQRLEPLDADPYFSLGTLYLAQRDHGLAIPYLEKAVLLNPRMEEAYVMLGKAYLQANSVENLGAMASTARKWFPSNVELDALMATYYFRKRQYEQALDLARVVVTRDPRNILALAILSSPSAQELTRR